MTPKKVESVAPIREASAMWNTSSNEHVPSAIRICSLMDHFAHVPPDKKAPKLVTPSNRAPKIVAGSNEVEANSQPPKREWRAKTTEKEVALSSKIEKKTDPEVKVRWCLFL